MPSVLKAATEVQKRKDKGKGKSSSNGETETKIASASTENKIKPRKDKNLLISSRGVTQRMRHLMIDLEALLPHTKKGQLRSSRL
jgi:ribosome biogenesis protein BRX1